jgi:lantibiotic leader peptide-processing serine protease
MKRYLAFASLLVSFSALAADSYVVRFKGNVPDSFNAAVIAKGGKVDTLHKGSGIAIVSGLSEADAAALENGNGVGEVIANDKINVRLGTSTLQDSEEQTIEESSTTAPETATYYPWQWHLRAIGAEKAWAAGRLGSPEVTVAVLDTGISYEHADLIGRVDLSRSVSFVPSDDALVEAYFPGMHPVTDLYYHGTHVAATISSNAVIAAGVTSNVKLLGVKVLGADGSGTFGGVLQGVLWAADHGADVANLSLGDAFLRRGNGRIVSIVQQVFNYANRKGMVVVVAAGNESLDLDHDKNLFKSYCSAANVVCVSATGPTFSPSEAGPWTDVDAFAPYSNYGRSSISVAAPGGYWGAIWAACAPTSLLIPECAGGSYAVGLGGTSMAAPHVAGLAALIVEDVGHGRPSRVKAILQQTADDLGTPGTDPQYGKGRINVAKALGLE